MVYWLTASFLLATVPPPCAVLYMDFEIKYIKGKRVFDRKGLDYLIYYRAPVFLSTGVFAVKHFLSSGGKADIMEPLSR